MFETSHDCLRLKNHGRRVCCVAVRSRLGDVLAGLEECLHACSATGRGGVSVGAPIVRPSPLCSVDVTQLSVDTTEVAEGVGYGVEVLLSRYANRLAGRQEAADCRVEALLIVYD